MSIVASFNDPSSIEDLPPPSVELDALILLVEAFIEMEGPEKGQEFLLHAARIMARRESLATVLLEFERPKESQARAKVRRQTAAWFRKSLPVWLERLRVQRGAD